MAIAEAGPAPTQAERWSIFATFGLGVYLYSAAVGVLPFTPMRLETYTQSGDGDLLRQLLMLGGAFVVLLGTPRSSLRLPLILPPLVLLAIGWSAVTLVWSPVPAIGARRLVLTAVSVVVVFTYADGFGVERLVRVMTGCLTALVFGSLLAGLIVPAAIHQATDLEPSLAGDWRGLFFHKNTAGLVAAVVAIIHFWRALERRRFLYVSALAASLLLLLLSGAKTSLVALPLALLTAAAIHFLSGRLLGRFWLFVFAIIAFLMVAVIVRAEWDAIEQFLDDPRGLTGRAAMWAALFQLGRTGAWLLGVGYASIFAVGESTPLAPYLEGWLVAAGSAHNGYLELMLTVGVPGLVLVLLAFQIQPLWRLLGPSAVSSTTRNIALSILVFLAVHNVTETSLMDRGNVGFLLQIVVLSIACANGVRKQPE